MTRSEDEADLAKANEALEKAKATAASMADIKALETTLTSSMNVKFDEFSDMFMKFAKGKLSEDIYPTRGYL